MSSMFGIAWLVVLPVLIAQWVGVMAIGRMGKTGAWWVMLVGTLLSTVGGLASVAATVSMIMGVGPMAPGASSSPFQGAMMVMMAVSAVSMLGGLLFAIGFAIHGMQAKRIMERIEELETVIVTQQEQLARGEAGGA